MSFKNGLKKVWHFIWKEDSFASWVVNVILAFIIVKFLIYPGLGLLLGTSYPVVAVVSSSMEHNTDFENWWVNSEKCFNPFNITKEKVSDYKFKNGFNKGDIMVLVGRPMNVKIGDVIVFQGSLKDPIIHRVMRIYSEDGNYYIQTKGDNYLTNCGSRQDEQKIPTKNLYGRAVFRLPWLGWVKITAVCGLNQFSSNQKSFFDCMKQM
ncbi:MAG: signal peptidase I [Candidatus Nanoarchaeia archaeon]|nr:signal peptidase I [Candidatus Nanoarchaeia archaeon]